MIFYVFAIGRLGKFALRTATPFFGGGSFPRKTANGNFGLIKVEAVILRGTGKFARKQKSSR